MVRLAWWVGIYLVGACTYTFTLDWNLGNFQSFNLEQLAATPLYPILITSALLMSSLSDHYGWVILFGVSGVYLLHLSLSLHVKRFRTFCGMLGILTVVLISNFFSVLHSLLHQ